MSKLALQLFSNIEPNALGEFLRALTFPGEGFGCYENFEVRPEAEKWEQTKQEDFWFRYFNEFTPEGEARSIAIEISEMGEGYTYRLLDDFNIFIDVCWYWDGDGCLDFMVYEIDSEIDQKIIIRHIENTDCKKNYRWEDV